MSPPTLRGLPSPSHKLPLLTSLRADLELSPASAAVMPRRRGFPAPPTGHELMALFPPPPPNPIMGSTSSFFCAQERAFFACKGKEIVAVQIEADMHTGPSQPHPHAHPHTHPHSQPPAPAEQTARQTSRSPRTHPGHALALPPKSGSLPPTQESARAPRGIPVIPIAAQSAPAVSALSPYPHPAPPQHARMTPPHAPMDVQTQYPMHPPPPQQAEEHGGKQTQQMDGYMGEDEARMRPMPHNERRTSANSAISEHLTG
ncbi:uncharacterized protein B0H18DRAFT_1085712 [Fomitopsis serialis]|uniref:uncharacterized protein n=1 Tax=Fomitopsis serialis TaxID=139415 RepID=UPI0020086F2C|nr:uncharacterized protein B0H18DRAFT_1085712 [Neoantrodia serialis]KAH9923317.1 hypothetical protein B0H18DRAFT_1085712 [Neoantrodia serialis]